MKPFGIVVLSFSLAGCAAQQGQPLNAQAARTETCKVSSEQEIAALFDRWNQSLQTGDPLEWWQTMRSVQFFWRRYQTSLA